MARWETQQAVWARQQGSISKNVHKPVPDLAMSTVRGMQATALECLTCRMLHHVLTLGTSDAVATKAVWMQLVNGETKKS